MLQHIHDVINDFLYKFWLWIFSANLTAVIAWFTEYSPVLLTAAISVVALLAALVRLKRERIELQLSAIELEEKQRQRAVDEAQG